MNNILAADAKVSRGRGAEGKTAVVGIVERKGNLKANAVPDTKKTTVMPLVESKI